VASTYLTPGIYIEEIPGGSRPIQSVGTSTAGFVGEAPDPKAPVNAAVAIDNWSQFRAKFVGEATESTMLAQGVYGFFLNGGGRCYIVNVGKGGALSGGGKTRGGLELLETVDEVAIVAAPGYSDAVSHTAIIDHCEKMKDRVAILDPPVNFADIQQLKTVATADSPSRRRRPEDAGAAPDAPAGLRPRPSDGGYAAFYAPWITVRNPLAPSDRPNELIDVPPSGHIAGVYARTDATRGVHTAPANKSIAGALNVTYPFTGQEQGELNQEGVNCIRLFSREGIRIWGARTLAPAASEWRYINVRRLFNMIEESIAQHTRWVVFEPNDPSLWKAIRRDVSAFLRLLWRDGALMGATPEEAFFVKCDSETNPPEVIDEGRVVTVIGVAPVKPAEFVIFKIGQHAGGVEVE
jgi:hypothetical protein